MGTDAVEVGHLRPNKNARPLCQCEWFAQALARNRRVQDAISLPGYRSTLRVLCCDPLVSLLALLRRSFSVVSRTWSEEYKNHSVALSARASAYRILETPSIHQVIFPTLILGDAQATLHLSIAGPYHPSLPRETLRLPHPRRTPPITTAKQIIQIHRRTGRKARPGGNTVLHIPVILRHRRALLRHIVHAMLRRLL